MAVGIAALLFIGGYSFAATGFTKADLSKILEAEWKAYKSDKPSFTGGLAMQILSLKGDYFLSTGMGDDVTGASHFRIASVTKTFTGAAIALLDQRKLLNIDDKITGNIPGTKTPYVPDTPEYDIPYKKDITIRTLLMHRAGVFDVSNNPIPDNEFSHGQPYAGRDYLEYMKTLDKDHTFTFDELVGVVAKDHLSFFKPGTAYHYSDTGYSILGKIVERVSGKRYSDFIKDELLVPNGLLETSLPWKGSDQSIPAPFVKGYVWIDGKTEEVTRSNMSPHVAEGNMTSTAVDLANWCKKLMTGRAGLDKATVEMMKTGMDIGDGTGSKYGLGIGSSEMNGYGHAGAHEGYLTLMYYDPKTDTAYVIFTNEWNLQGKLDSLMSELKYMLGIARKIFRKMED